MDINRVSLFNAFRSSTSTQLPVVSRYDDTKQNYLHDLPVTNSTLRYAIGKLYTIVTTVFELVKHNEEETFFFTLISMF